MSAAFRSYQQTSSSANTSMPRQKNRCQKQLLSETSVGILDEAALLILITFFLGQRMGDMAKLQLQWIRCLNASFLVLTLVEGKLISKIGPYSLMLHSSHPVAQIFFRHCSSRAAAGETRCPAPARSYQPFIRISSCVRFAEACLLGRFLWFSLSASGCGCIHPTLLDLWSCQPDCCVRNCCVRNRPPFVSLTFVRV